MGSMLSGNRRKLTLMDVQHGLEQAIAELENKTGIKVTEKRRNIPDGMSFRQWCEKLGEDGMLVDGKPFKLDDRPAMAWIYDQIPSTKEEAYNLIIVLMKCAQVGFTVMEILSTIYLGLKFGPCIIGMFLPDMNLAGLKSTERFMPIVRSVPSIHSLMTQDAPDGTGKKSGEGNVNRRRIGNALFIFSWTSGRATTESIPLDSIMYDEVQEMTKEQLEKTSERISASTLRFTLMGSTANWPDEDIHHWYLKGSQHRFYTKCRICETQKPLDDYFPECIKYDKETQINKYVCPKGHWIDDPQDGEWIAEKPENDAAPNLNIPLKDRPKRIRSIHFPQFLSPTISAGEIINAYGSATDMKNFFNRKLGKPYLDPSQIPVNMEHLAHCERLGIEAGLVWKQRARGTFMGIDQMGRFNVHVIKERMPDGRQAVIHVEETYAEDPFARSSELMEMFGVQCCVVEVNPNYNDAKRFANRHSGKVFICDSFGKIAEGMISWGDAPRMNASDRRTDEDERDRYTLRMDQYKCMQVSMARFTGALCLFPDRQSLIQEVLDKDGRMVTAPVLPRAFHHFTKTALVAEKDEDTNKFKRSVRKVGIDPHFSYANMLCDVAWSRAHGTSTFILPEGGTEVSDLKNKALAKDMPGLPVHVVRMLEDMPTGEVCGRCTSFNPDTKMCEERAFSVQPADPRCDFFIPL